MDRRKAEMYNLFRNRAEKGGEAMSYYSEMLEVELMRNREAQKVFLDNLGQIGNFSLNFVRQGDNIFVYREETIDGEKRSSYVGIIESPEAEEAMKKADDAQYIRNGLKKLQEDEQKLIKAIEVLK